MSPLQRSALPVQLGLPAIAGAVTGGLLTGGFAAWAYYGDTFRPLAHTFGLWITLVLLLSARRQVREAVTRSACALAAAVLSFYLGKKVLYGIEYPGMPYALDQQQIGQWLILAAIAGSLFGWLFSRAGRDGTAGAVATAGAVGLLAGDALRRGASYPGDGAVVYGTAVVWIVLVLAVTVRTARQFGLVALCTAPMTALGYALVSAPDALEQLLITGRL